MKEKARTNICFPSLIFFLDCISFTARASSIPKDSYSHTTKSGFPRAVTPNFFSSDRHSSGIIKSFSPSRMYAWKFESRNWKRESAMVSIFLKQYSFYMYPDVRARYPSLLQHNREGHQRDAP